MRIGFAPALALAILGGMPARAIAQAPVAPAAALDPARLTAATELLDMLMPAATREQMIQGMMTPLLANIRRGFSGNPGFATAMNGNPQLKALFDDFMSKQEARTTEMMRQALPGMVASMARAYARRFDVGQLHELRAFFRTSTGRVYVQASYTIMADPDVAAWQTQLMRQAMSRTQEDVASFAQKAAALEKNKKP